MGRAIAGLIRLSAAGPVGGEAGTGSLDSPWLPAAWVVHARLHDNTLPHLVDKHIGAQLGAALLVSLEEVDVLVEREAALVDQLQRSLACGRLAAARR